MQRHVFNPDLGKGKLNRVSFVARPTVQPSDPRSSPPDACGTCMDTWRVDDVPISK